MKNHETTIATGATVLIALLLTGQNVLHLVFNLFGGAGRDAMLSAPVLFAVGLAGLLISAKISIERRKNISTGEESQFFRIYEFLRIAGGLGLYMLAASFWSPNLEYGLHKTLLYFIFNLGLPLVILHQVRTPRLMRSLILFVFIFSLILGTHALLISLNNVTSLTEMDLYGADITIEDPAVEMAIGLGRRAGLGLLAGLALFALDRTHKYRALLALALLFLAFIIVKSGSRAALAGSVFGIMVFLSLTLNRRAIMQMLMVIFALASLYALATRFSDGLIAYRWERSTIERDTETRLAMSRHAIGVFFDHPLRGGGTGGWGTVFFGPGINMYPHNIFAEISAELGVIGMSLFIVFLTQAIKKGLYLRYTLGSGHHLSIMVSFAIALLVMGLLFAQFSGHIARNEWIWIAAAIIFQLHNFCYDKTRSVLRPRQLQISLKGKSDVTI